MIEEIRPNLYRVQIPLPNTPLRYLNSYFIRGNERHLVIDTGFDIPECHEAMQDGFTALGIDPERTDYFITHLHMDHFGLVNRLATPSSNVYFNRPDADFMRKIRPREMIIAFAVRHGFPETKIQDAIEKSSRYRVTNKMPNNLVLMDEGDSLCVGPYQFRCVHTPGHSFGHLCLYDAGRRLFIAGDHLMKDISPGIQSWDDVHNPLQMYIESLEKVYGLDIDLVLPGHRGLITDHRSRIDELKDHHQHRCLEIESILGTVPTSAYEVTARMTWNIRGASWKDYPNSQRLFAMGEALAHLKYMEEESRITRDENNGRCAYIIT